MERVDLISYGKCGKGLFSNALGSTYNSLFYLRTGFSVASMEGYSNDYFSSHSWQNMLLIAL